MNRRIMKKVWVSCSVGLDNRHNRGTSRLCFQVMGQLERLGKRYNYTRPKWAPSDEHIDRLVENHWRRTLGKMQSPRGTP